MRYVRNKKTGQIQKVYPRWNGQEHVYFPVNDQWEYIEKSA